MSKARQSKRQRYRKPRADYQAGGRVNVRTGGRRFTELDAVMPRGGRKIGKKENPTTPKPTPRPAAFTPANISAATEQAAATSPATMGAEQFEPAIAKLPENVTGNPASLTTTRRPGRLPRRDPEPTTPAEEQETTVTSSVPADNNEADSSANPPVNIDPPDDDDDSGSPDKPSPEDPEVLKARLLAKQATTDPKIQKIDVAKTDDSILTTDDQIQKIKDPTDIEPADAVKAKDLTTTTGTAQQGELTEAKDTVTYDAVDAEAVDPTTAAQGTVDRDVVAGQATMTERAVAAERDAAQEEAAKAQKQDFTISDDAFVDEVTFREGVSVVETDPAEQQQRQVQLGMPAPDGEAAQIINKYGFGNSKRPRRLVRGAKAKQQAAAQLAADHDLAPEVADQIMEDVEGFDVEGQTQESLGAVAALPKEALVSTQIENLVSGMEDGKPPVWARPAVAAVEQMMAARGLSASTVGRDALFNSIIQSAMPIAQANATALQQRAAQNLSNEQQALIQDRQIAASFLEKNAEFKQQMEIANLSNDQQMRLANLTSRNQNASENLSAAQQTEMANLNARLQTNLTAAKIAESMGVAQLSVDQQRAVANATMVAKVDMAKFSADQQVELANSKFMQTLTSQDLNNRQQASLQNATLMAQMDITNATERTKASVANAQNYLKMNIANVNNRQQATIIDQQLKQQRLLSDQAAENAARQFNAKSENQNNQFMVSMANQMEQFNTAQLNTMEQFNIGEKNRMEAIKGEQQLKADSFNAEQINRLRQFDAELEFRAESWNAQNAQAVQQSNIEWRRKSNTINTAAQNAVNATNAQMQFGMSNQAQAALWQQLRDAAHFNHQNQQSENDRKMNIVNAAIGNETLMTHRDFKDQQNKIWAMINQLTGQQSSQGTDDNARGYENLGEETS